MEKTYSWNEEEQTLTVFSNTGVKDYCRENGVTLEDYNYKTIIDPSVEDCSEMFCECQDDFNYDDDDYDLYYPYRGCESFNQPIEIPEGVKNCNSMFYRCSSFNQSITVPESVKDRYGMFLNCFSLNQPIEISGGVTERDDMFAYCNFINDDGSVKTYNELSGITKNIVTKSLAEKAVQKSYLKQEVELTSQECDLVDIYKKQKALVVSLGGDREAKAYEKNNPDAFKEYNAYNAALSKAKAEHGIENKVQQAVVTKENDKQFE